jgi:hypothetical protein
MHSSIEQALSTVASLPMPQAERVSCSRSGPRTIAHQPGTATNYAGTFVKASTISIKQSPVDVDVNAGAILLFKEPTAALGMCVTDSHE